MLHLHLPVLVWTTHGEEPLQGDAEHDVDAGHEAEGKWARLVIISDFETLHVYGNCFLFTVALEREKGLCLWK